MEEKHVPVLRERPRHRGVLILRFHRDDPELPDTGEAPLFILKTGAIYSASLFHEFASDVRIFKV